MQSWVDLLRECKPAGDRTCKRSNASPSPYHYTTTQQVSNLGAGSGTLAPQVDAIKHCSLTYTLNQSENPPEYKIETCLIPSSTRIALIRGPTDCILTSDLDFWHWPSIPGEPWSWPIHMQKVKVKDHSVQKLTVETDGQMKAIVLPDSL